MVMNCHDTGFGKPIFPSTLDAVTTLTIDYNKGLSTRIIGSGKSGPKLKILCLLKCRILMNVSFEY